LTGHFKARSQNQQSILIPIAYATASGLQPGKWGERLLQVLAEFNVHTGWAFQDARGKQLPMSHFDEKFYDLLAQIKEEDPNLFTAEIDLLEDYHLARSFRRGATSRAGAVGVRPEDVDWINRWNVGADPGASSMRVLYSDQLLMLDTFLRFSLPL
jgi:hypothetical protein